MIFCKPLIEWKRIEIDNGYLVVFKRFYKPLRVNIVESLYQIIVKDEYIHAFRLRCGEYHHTKITPAIYKNGDEMAKTLSEYILEHKIIVDVMIKYLGDEDQQGWGKKLQRPSRCRQHLHLVRQYYNLLISTT
jgi:hypothetical protein